MTRCVCGHPRRTHNPRAWPWPGCQTVCACTHYREEVVPAPDDGDRPAWNHDHEEAYPHD